MTLLKNKSKAMISAAAAVSLLATVAVFAAEPGGGGGPGGPGGGGNMGRVELSESVISVKLTEPSVGSLTRETEFIGKIEPAESVSVYPEVSGKVTAVHFEAGESVRQGALLFEIDDGDAQLAYQVARAGYDQKLIDADTTLGSGYDSKLLSAKSKLDSAQQSLNNARLKLKDYNDGCDDDLTRAEKLRDQYYEQMQTCKDDPDKQAEYEKAETQYLLYRAAVNELEDGEDSEARDLRNSYKNAQTSYEEALESYNLVKGGSLEDQTKSTEANLKSAELSLQQSANTLDKYKVYAPISGVIETRTVSAHDQVNAQTAAYTISNKNTMSVTFNATADAATALRIGDGVSITKSGKTFAALITSIDSKADGATGLFPVEAQIQDDDGTLLSGVTVKVSAATQKAEDAILVPIDNVYYEDGQAYVFTYADGKARRTDFETGMSNSETVVAVSGLTLDSEIITTWHPDLKDGASVQLAEGQAAPAAGGEPAAPGGAAADNGEDLAGDADAPAGREGGAQ